jgi:hypothetical protein
LDQSNFPEAVVAAGAVGGADIVGATVVLPERGGSIALLPAGAGSAAKAWNARLNVPAPTQNLQKSQNFKNDRCGRGEDMVENSFDPVLRA